MSSTAHRDALPRASAIAHNARCNTVVRRRPCRTADTVNLFNVQLLRVSIVRYTDRRIGQVLIRLRLRRFFYNNAECGRRTFAGAGDRLDAGADLDSHGSPDNFRPISVDREQCLAIACSDLSSY